MSRRPATTRAPVLGATAPASGTLADLGYVDGTSGDLRTSSRATKIHMAFFESVTATFEDRHRHNSRALGNRRSVGALFLWRQKATAGALGSFADGSHKLWLVGVQFTDKTVRGLRTV